jgi:hypothetical protein
VITWALCIFFGFLTLKQLVPGLTQFIHHFSSAAAIKPLKQAEAILFEWDETLQAGWSLESAQIERAETLSSPWSELLESSVKELRERGAALRPTLGRLRELAQEQIQSIQEAQSKSSLAVFQAAVCAVLVPAFGAALYLLLPGLNENALGWILCCTVAGAGVLCGAVWMVRLAEQARWASLHPSQRRWIFLSLCTAERLLALIRAGLPPDLAWHQALEFLTKEAPELAHHWGSALWTPSEMRPEIGRAVPALRALYGLGESLRTYIQVSLMEGRPSLERIESSVTAFRRDFKALQDRELQVLGQRALKPLFICVAPSLLLLLGLGLLFSAPSDLWLWIG